jgi:hypothetical protein
MEMDTGSSNDVIADLFGSRAGGAKNTELFGNAFSTFYGAGAGAGTNVGTSYVSRINYQYTSFSP